MKESIRILQKIGEFEFQGVTREKSKELALNLAKEALQLDIKNGIDCSYGIARDAFGYYKTVVIN